MSKLPVMEIFGPTIQGEGMVIGQKTMFVRTAGCDYSCSWCDSAFTWDGSGKDDIDLMTAEEILSELRNVGGQSFSHVTISGGNPALLKNLGELVLLLKENNIQTALETQGSKWQDWMLEINDLTISPKPPSSNMVTDFGVLDLILDQLRHHSHTSLKVVIFDENDLTYAKTVHLRYPQVPLFLQVGNDDISNMNNQELTSKLLMKYEALVNAVMEDAKLNNVRILPQLHALIWGNKRGV
ncbi:7-carboxy-7-deazaguanine synthase QueE [Mesobacillus harenae]|uniref:7-carboxy-7-deazaguanine synthase QueE n=1 Tax=Mesobacillus harenae TaxID=2213203 RepID=UPI001580EDD4|nr:7-carboxy-7-deazaguanine synthase QueE [Mesobacillus harenae]